MIFGFGKNKKDEKQKQEAAKAKPQEPQAQEEAAPTKQSLLGRLKQGLSKSTGQLTGGIKDIFTKHKLDAETLEELEDLLIGGDFGVATATEVVDVLRSSKYDKEISAEEVAEVLAETIANTLQPVEKPLELTADKPCVLLFCGVNGTGKTTTIGKMAKRYADAGKKVVVAACDTFRAAAVEQLQVWAERAGCEIILGAEQADPASVAYQALEKAQAIQADVLLIDTAGRLQNKKNLMEQLAKVVRVVQKIDANAPHESILVLDATTGQNAKSQMEIFNQVVDVSGLVITKLDGTAKGGVVVQLAKQFETPIYGIGVGERVEDLQEFNAQNFAKQLAGVAES